MPTSLCGVGGGRNLLAVRAVIKPMPTVRKLLHTQAKAVVEHQGAGTASIRASLSRLRQLESVISTYRTAAIATVADAVLPALPLPPHVITVLVKVGNVSEHVTRGTLIKACRGPDAQTATAAIAKAACKILKVKYNGAMSLQSFHQGCTCAADVEDGKNGIYDLLIAADTIVLNRKWF
eukprot:jgi/Chrzof1/5975/Cz16g22100.t1